MTTDLFGWRPFGLHTLVSLSGLLPAQQDGARLRCSLLDRSGRELSSWDAVLPPNGAVFFDSRQMEPTPDAVTLLIDTPDLGAHQLRDGLYGLIDWYDDETSLASLHSDHTVSDDSRGHELTEIVVEPAPHRRHHLVISNGPTTSRRDSIAVAVAGHPVAVPAEPLEPFARVEVEIDARHLDQPGDVTGEIKLEGHFCRPYVVTSGDRFEAYHGGNRYATMRPVPSAMYDLLGHGEVNPMLVVEDHLISTRVHLFNSHGAIDRDFDVDLTLYDCDGAVIAHHPRWKRAVRGGVVTESLRSALPAGDQHFTGHAALSFSRSNTDVYPGRLQALFQYDSPVNSARAMVWSDTWNSPLRGEHPGRLVAFSRVWFDDLLQTDVSITNCGLPGRRGPYDATVEARLDLINADGERLTTSIDVGPQATAYQSVAALFPDAAEFLAPHGYGMVHVSASGDLAMVQVTRHQVSGALGIEHFMAAPSIGVDGKEYMMAGA